jgi:hypothetical protein
VCNIGSLPMAGLLPTLFFRPKRLYINMQLPLFWQPIGGCHTCIVRIPCKGNLPVLASAYSTGAAICVPCKGNLPVLASAYSTGAAIGRAEWRNCLLYLDLEPGNDIAESLVGNDIWLMRRCYIGYDMTYATVLYQVWYDVCDSVISGTIWRMRQCYIAGTIYDWCDSVISGMIWRMRQCYIGYDMTYATVLYRGYDIWLMRQCYIGYDMTYATVLYRVRYDVWDSVISRVRYMTDATVLYRVRYNMTDTTVLYRVRYATRCVPVIGQSGWSCMRKLPSLTVQYGWYLYYQNIVPDNWWN